MISNITLLLQKVLQFYLKDISLYNFLLRNSWGTEQGIFNNVSMTPLQLRVLLSDMRKAKVNMEALS